MQRETLMAENNLLLEIKDLKTYFFLEESQIQKPAEKANKPVRKK